MLFQLVGNKVVSGLTSLWSLFRLSYWKKFADNLMSDQSFGIVHLMGAVVAKIKKFVNHLSRKDIVQSSDEPGKHSDYNGRKETREIEEMDDNDEVQNEETEKAKEKIVLLEKQLSTQKIIMDEHQEKIRLLEDLIKRQCLILKENDDVSVTYEQLAKSIEAPVETKESINLWERIESLLNAMIEKKEVKEGDPLMKIKHDFEAQRLQLEQHDESIKKHEEDLEDQLAKIETMREILDENANHTGYGVKSILDDHEKRLTALENRMVLYEKQVEKRLLEQHQLLVFTWVGLITTFVLCFAIVCSCCWFR